MRPALKQKVTVNEAAIPPEERLQALFGELQRRKSRSDNPLKRSFVEFLRHIRTIDEARAGEVRPWPMDERVCGRCATPYIPTLGSDWVQDCNCRSRPMSWLSVWRAYEHAMLSNPVLLIDKTRRVMASNTVLAFDLWILCGGQDERWPSLMRSDRNRSVIIQSKKKDEAGGSAEFVQKMAMMYENAVTANIRDAWPDFPEWEWKLESGRNSIGGKVQAVPQGKDQVVGAGVTLLHMEELSLWTDAPATIGQAIPALRPEGHLIAVTTPRAASFAAKIRRGEML